METKNGQLLRIVRFGSGRRTRTSDLRVMSPTSCQLLYPAMYLQRMPKHPIYRFCECKDKANFRILQIKSAFSRLHTPFRLPYRPLRTDCASGHSPYPRTLLPASGRTADDKQTADRRMGSRSAGELSNGLFGGQADRRIQRIRLATTSARSHTSVEVPRTSAFLHSGQAVTIASAPVAVSSSATDTAMRT